MSCQAEDDETESIRGVYFVCRKEGGTLRPEGRFWIVKDGIKVFGKGPFLLLRLVVSLGSLKKAAAKMNMSYSKAWSIIDRAEKALGLSLLKTQVGGAEGGGSSVTPEAKVLMNAYEDFVAEMEICTDTVFAKYFARI